MPPKGQKLSEEARQKIRESRLGKSSWNKGIPFSEESKEKMRQAKLGKTKSPEFKQRRAEIMREKWKDPVFREEMRQKKLGINNPNYGKPMSEERKRIQRDFANSRIDGHIEKMRQGNIGRKHSDETRKKMSITHSREKCYNWKGGITPVYKAIRGRLEYKRWCKALLEKNNYTDFFTGARGGLLSCHHLISVSLLIRLYKVETIEQALACPYIWDLQNGIVMLKSAHDKFHNTYGDITNIYELTDAQIQELYSNP